MVKPSKHTHTILILTALFLLVIPFFVSFASAQGVTYSVTQEWTRVEINPDRSINIFYNITFSYLSGSPQGILTLGMPKAGYQIQTVEDHTGNTLTYQTSADTNYGIDINLNKPIILNQPINFIVYATAPDMIYQDDTNPGNVGMQFYPSTFQYSTGTANLRLQITLPTGIQTNQTKYPTGLPFDNVFVTEENRTAVYWERPTWPAEQTFTAGVSFPEGYVSPAPSQPPSGTDLPDIAIIFGILGFLAVAGAIVAVFIALSKVTYVKPQISVEALGANRTLTAVEAGLVLGQKPVRVLTMILYGLILKRQVTVTQTEPILKLQKTPKPEDAIPTGPTPPGATPITPRYYEIDYLSAIKPDGTLNEKTLAQTYQGLTSTVNQKLRGYSREDTAKYYTSIVNAAWKQVTNAGTPELKGDALNTNIDWLLSDQKFDTQFKTIFPPGTIITPNPAWWWYWSIPRTPTSPSRPTPYPSTPTPSIPSKPFSLPGQDFANTVVLSLQSASNNMVKNIQDFANQLVPFQPPPNSQSVHKESCVCACHSCACACACVSCACACAGGGAH
jgi:hypothetical protein